MGKLLEILEGPSLGFRENVIYQSEKYLRLLVTVRSVSPLHFGPSPPHIQDCVPPPCFTPEMLIFLYEPLGTSIRACCRVEKTEGVQLAGALPAALCLSSLVYTPKTVTVFQIGNCVSTLPILPILRDSQHRDPSPSSQSCHTRQPGEPSPVSSLHPPFTWVSPRFQLITDSLSSAPACVCASEGSQV